jgi:putative addiction module component (TIGR02574 family)
MGRMSTKELLDAALALAPADRARLANDIIASLDETGEVEPQLASEIERRIHEIDSGTVKAIPWAEVKARIARRRRAG